MHSVGNQDMPTQIYLRLIHFLRNSGQKVKSNNKVVRIMCGQLTSNFSFPNITCIVLLGKNNSLLNILYNLKIASRIYILGTTATR